MKESAERTVKVGFSRSPKKVFDQVEAVTAAMVREGWEMKNAVLEESLGNIHLFFERDVADGRETGPGARPEGFRGGRA